METLQDQEDSFLVVSSSPRSEPRRTSRYEKTPRSSKKSLGQGSFHLIRTPSSSLSASNDDLDFSLVVRPPKQRPQALRRKSSSLKIAEETVRINEKSLRGIYEELVRLEKTLEVEIDFSHFLFNKEETKQLEGVLKQISHIQRLKLIIQNKKKGSINSIIQQLFNVFDNGSLRSLESLKIDFFRSQIAAECVDYFNKEVFPKLNSIKTFHINLFGSDVDNQVIQELARSFQENFAEIEDFSCNLGLTKVTEEVILQFFHEMPKLKHFELNVGNCAFTDYAMKIFIRDTLLSMNSLESFVFKIEATTMMSCQIMDFFKNLPVSLKKLYLDLRWTRTTNETLKFFIHEKLPSLTSLEEAELKVESTLVSNKMKKEIEAINKKYAKKIDIEECLKYVQMVKARYSAKDDFDSIALEKEAL